MTGGHVDALDSPAPRAGRWKHSIWSVTASAARLRPCSGLRAAGRCLLQPPLAAALLWRMCIRARLHCPYAAPAPSAWAATATMMAPALLSLWEIVARLAILRCAVIASCAAFALGCWLFRSRVTLSTLCSQKSAYFKYLTGLCGGNAANAAFVDTALSVIPGLITPEQNLHWYEALCEMFTTTQPYYWACKVYAQFMLEGDSDVLSETGAEGRLRVLVNALVARVDGLLLPLGFTNKGWLELIGMGSGIVLPDGRTAKGTTEHQDQGVDTKLILSISLPNDGRGLGFCGGPAPRGGCQILYPPCGAFFGTAFGFLQVENGGHPGLKHYSLSSERPGFAVVLRYAGPSGRVAAHHHPNIESLLSGLAALPASAPPTSAFSASANRLDAFTAWEPAQLGRLEVRIVLLNLECNFSRSLASSGNHRFFRGGSRRRTGNCWQTRYAGGGNVAGTGSFAVSS